MQNSGFGMAQVHQSDISDPTFASTPVSPIFPIVRVCVFCVWFLLWQEGEEEDEGGIFF